MFTKEIVRERIDSMRSRFGMYAMTKEAYEAMLCILLEAVGVSPERIRDYTLTLRPEGAGASAAYLLDRLDKSFAEKACDAATKILNSLDT